jgi:lysophospholipase L1-like esterase
MSVGGNDLLTLLAGPPPSPSQVQQVLAQFAGNVGAILAQLCSDLPPSGGIYLNNLYTVPEIPGADQVVPLFNNVLSSVVGSVRALPECADKTIGLADVYGAFLGKPNLLLIERYIRKGIQTAEVHPTDKGYRAMEDAFRAVIEH